MKILFTLFFLLFSSSVVANTKDTVSSEELIEVKTSNDKHCYYTKITKPINEYQEYEEYEGYYFLKTNKSCDQFLEFQNKLYEQYPEKSHIPFSGKSIAVNEDSLELNESIYLEGKITERITKNILTGMPISRWIYNTYERINEEYNEDGEITFKKIFSEVLNSSDQYKDYRFYETIYYDENKRVLLNFKENLENNSIELKRNQLEPSYYSWKNNDYTYFVLKTQKSYIVFQLENYNNKNVKYLVEHFVKPPSWSDYIQSTEINSFINGVKKFSIRVNFDKISTKDDFRVELFDQGKAVIEYSITSSTLTFESTIKNNKQHGVRIQWGYRRNEIVDFKCTDNGFDNEIDIEKDLISCDSNYLYDLRISEREKYFISDLRPNQILLDQFILLDAFLKLYPR